MGSASSSPDGSTLELLTGPQPIPQEDPFWQTLLTTKVPLQHGGSLADLEAASLAFCTELLRNNGQTGNFQSLILCTLDLLGQAQAPLWRAATDTRRSVRDRNRLRGRAG